MFRIALVPILVIILLSEGRGVGWAAWGIFTLAALSDMADGMLARHLNLESQFGKLIDPVADKILVMAVLVCLVDLGAIPAWVAILIVARELVMSGFRILGSDRGITIVSSVLGKLKMWVEATTLGMLLLGESVLQGLYVLARIGVWVTLAIVWVSAFAYFFRYGPPILKDGPHAF
jgi:CDP-diacylglycerol--glycerol-3-phosphate 3-phosphatidyltransferase